MKDPTPSGSARSLTGRSSRRDNATDTDYSIMTTIEDETTAERIQALEEQLEALRAVRKGESGSSEAGGPEEEGHSIDSTPTRSGTQLKKKLYWQKVQRAIAGEEGRPEV